jgi:DNA-binding NarL/FixJ family response regulator
MPTGQLPHDARPRVAIVDADRRIQKSLAEVLRVAGDVEIVGWAGDVGHALEMIAETRPTVVVLDPRLPDVAAGAAFMTSLNRRWPAICVVMTGWADAGEQPALAARADAFVSKSAPPEDFVAAVVRACDSAGLSRR